MALLLRSQHPCSFDSIPLLCLSQAQKAGDQDLLSVWAFRPAILHLSTEAGDALAPLGSKLRMDPLRQPDAPACTFSVARCDVGFETGPSGGLSKS